MSFSLNLKIVNSCCRLTKELTNFSFYVHQYCESKRLFKILFCDFKSKKNRPFVHQGNIRCTKYGTRPKDVLKDKYDLTRRMISAFFSNFHDFPFSYSGTEVSNLRYSQFC